MAISRQVIVIWITMNSKNGIGAVVEADLTDSTLITAGYTETNHNPNGVNWGSNPLISTEGEQLSYSRNYNYSPDWAYWDSNIKNYFAEIEQQLGADWKAKLVMRKNGLTGIQNFYSCPVNLVLTVLQVFSYIQAGILMTKEQQASLSFSGTYPLWGQP